MKNKTMKYFLEQLKQIYSISENTVKCLQHYENTIVNIHRLTGLPKDEIVDKFYTLCYNEGYSIDEAYYIICNTYMDKFKSLNLNILQNKKTTIISTQESLKDVTPINWSEEILSGKTKGVLNMAMIDYRAILYKNNKQMNNSLFMNMEEAVGFTLDEAVKENGETERVKDEYFVYMGDKELLVCIYKTQVLIISNGKVIKHLYRLDDDNLSYNRYRLKFNINGVDFDIRKLNDKSQYKLRFWYKGDLYECVYGYGVEI